MDRLKLLVHTGFFHIFGSSVVNKIVAFMSSVLLVRILSKQEYGIFAYAWNIYSIVLLANGFGVEYGALQICSERSGDSSFAKTVCNFALKTGSIADLLLAGVLVCIGTFAPLRFEASRVLLVMLCMLPVLKLWFSVLSVYLRSQKLNCEFAGLSTVNTLLVAIAPAIGAMLYKVRGLIGGYYVAYFISGFVCYRTIHKQKYDSCEKLNSYERRGLMSIALISMCNNGLSQLMYLLDVLVLGIVAADEAVLASYRVATIVPSALTFIPIALITYLYPYFAERQNDSEWCITRYKQVLLGLGSVNFLISLSLYMLAPWMIKVMFGIEYMDAIPVFRILAINYFFSGTFRILAGNLLVTQRKLRFNLCVAMLSGSVNIIADFFFIQWWGSIGAAYATVLTTAISGILNTFYLMHVFRKNKKTDCIG